MKKSLLALAVLGAFAGAAAAQTNVTLYGIADAGIGMADKDAVDGDSAMTVFSGIQSTSRFGIRGSEDLGGGLKATFNIEAGVNWDTGASDETWNASAERTNTFWQRRAVVGLASTWGEVRLGRDYTPGFTAAGTTDVMAYGLFGNWLTYTANGGDRGVTTRASNGLHYTGTFGGVTVRAMYATGEDYTGNNTGDMYGLSGVYASGPLTVQGYFQQTDRGPAGKNDQYGVGAQYNFGAFRVAVNYGMAKIDLNDVEHEGYGIGAGIRVGAGEVLVNYIHQELDTAGNPAADTIGVAYVHPLSKRTNLYASWGQTDNKDGGAFNLNYSQSSVATGGVDRKPMAVAVGIRHMF